MGIATESQLKASLIKITQPLDKSGRPSSVHKRCNFCISIPGSSNKANQKQNTSGYAYVWISNRNIFNNLLGLNIDGTERVVYENDKSVHLLKDEDGIECIVPKKRAILDPLIKLSGFEYTPKQVNILQQVSPKDIIPKLGYFRISAALIKKYIDGKSTNVLTGLIYNWIDDRMLFKFFKKFSTARNTVKKYPLVKILSTPQGPRAFVTFSPQTLDGQSVILLVKSFKFSDPTGLYNDVYLRFDHPPNNR